MSLQLQHLRRHEEAVSALKAAANAYRYLVLERGDTFRQGLAMSLHNLSNRLSEDGKKADALSAAREATTTLRHLVQAEGIAFVPSLARALDHLGVHLSMQGHRTEALAASREAVNLYRYIVSKLPADNAEILAGLAQSLANLGNRLSEATQLDEALAVVQEAVNMYREAASVDHYGFQTELIRALNFLGTHLSKLGRRSEALAAAEEAVGIARTLPREPSGHLADLGLSLNNLSNRLHDMGRFEEALVAVEEATRVLQGLSSTKQHRPLWALALNNQANRLASLGRFQDALQRAHEAEQVRRQLAEGSPETSLQDLADSMNDISNHYSNLDRIDEAVVAGQEAVALWRTLESADPSAYSSKLAMSLTNLSSHLSEIGRPTEALTAAQESVEIRRQLAADQPAAFLPLLAQSLNNLGNRLADMHRDEAALQALRQCASVYRRLFEEYPSAFTSRLAGSLSNLGAALGRVHDHDEALGSFREAIATIRRSPNPDAHQRLLGHLLSNEGSCLSALGKNDEALHAYQESIEVLEGEPVSSRSIGAYFNYSLHLEAVDASPERIEASLLTAIDALESKQALALSLSGKRLNLSRYALLYDRLTRLYACKLNAPVQALAASERGKARLINEMAHAAERPSARAPELSNDLRQQRMRLETIERRREALQRHAVLSLDVHDSQLRQLDEEAAESRRALVNVLERIVEADPDYARDHRQLSEKELTSLPDRAGALLLSFRVMDQGTIVFAQAPGRGIECLNVPEATTEAVQDLLIEEWLVPYYRGFVAASEAYQQNRTEATLTAMNVAFRHWLVSFDRARETLSNWFIPHLTPILTQHKQSGGTQLVLCPNRGLSLLPLHALSYSGAADDEYIMDAFTVRFTPSLTLFHRLLERDELREPVGAALALVDPLGDLAGAGDPLQQERILEVFPDLRVQAQGFKEREEATAEALIDLGAEAALVHLGCHGVYDVRNPLESYFQLAGRDQEDGRLSLSRLLQHLHLRKAWHVTLASCETNLVDFREQTDDYLGLACGFLLTGSPSVWGSLWTISVDATNLLLQRAYAELAQGIEAGRPDKAAALQRAQRFLRRTYPTYAHPFFWAGLQHVGA